MKHCICFFLLGACILALVVFSASARDVEKKFEIRSSQYSSDQLSFSQAYPDLGDLFQSAWIDTFYLAQYDFEVGNWQGWTRVDNTAQPGTFFHVAREGDELDGGDFGRLHSLEGLQSMWCGIKRSSDQYTCSWVGSSGYGNKWRQMLVSDRIYLGDPGSIGISLEYDISYDCEDGYDFVYVEYEQSDGSWVEIARCDSIGTQHGNHDISFADSTRVRFRFVSDGIFSDQDYEHFSDGAVIVDGISMSEYPVPYFVDYEDFEYAAVGDKDVDGDFNGFYWHADVGEPFGKYSGLMQELTDHDPCNENLSSQIVFFIGSEYWSTEYPGLAETPFCRETVAGETLCQNEMVVSPLIPNTGAGAVYKLNFAVYADLPVENCVFYRLYVRNIDGSGCPGPWLSDSWVYGSSDPEYLFRSIEFGDLVEPGTVDIQVALGVVDWCNLGLSQCDCAGHTPSPYFDNVSIQRVYFSAPVWSYNDNDLFQDNFPSDPANIESYVRADMAKDINSSDNPAIRPGDSIVVKCFDVFFGDELPYYLVTLHVKCEYIGPQDPPYGPKPQYLAGPSLVGNYGNYDYDDGVWTVIYSDQARIGGNPVPDTFIFDLNDSLFTRGYMISYYFKAYDWEMNRSHLPRNAWALAPMTYGTGTDQYKGVSYIFEFTCLPTGNSDILYVDDFDGQGTFWGEAEQYWNPSFLAVLPPGEYPDRYDVRAPAARVSNGPGSRAYANQLMESYKTIIWDSGNLRTCTISDGTEDSDKSNDAALLFDWINLSENDVGLWILGDDIAQDLDGSSDIALLLMDFCGVSNASDSYFDLTGGISAGGVVSPKVSAVPDLENPLWHGTWGDSLYAFGGCPKINKFDALETGTTGFNALQYQGPNGTPHYAGVYRYDINSMGYPARTMWFGFSMAYMRECENTEPMMRYQVVRDVLDWIGNSTGSDITGTGEVPAVNSLSQNFPNPFNPSTTIEFGLRGKGHVSLVIYDVAGRLVKTLIDEERGAGGHKVVWDGKNNTGSTVASGIYFYRLVAGDFVQTKKLVLLR